ncbi:MAG: transglutaminase domain-containing protein [Chloroflexi bacterium]|nr:transglutaminase domain-containing protein [Chloroflexota bacterium]
MARLRPAPGWFSLLLLVALIMVPFRSIVVAEWVEHLDILLWIVASAVALGLVMASLRASALLGHSVAMLTGTYIVFGAVAATLPKGSLDEKVIELWQRLFQWVTVVREGGVGTDNLLFLLLLASVAWLLSYFGVWTLARWGWVWWIVLAAGVGLAINLSYAYALRGYLLLFLISALFLIVRTTTAMQQRHWKGAQVDHEPVVPWEKLGASAVLGVAVIGVAWLLPALPASERAAETWQRVEGPWQQMQNEFSRAFAAVMSPHFQPTGGYGPALALGGPRQLGRTVLLEVETDQPRYLMTMVYDAYNGHGWVNEVRAEVTIPAGEPFELSEDGLSSRVVVEQRIRVREPRGNALFVTSQPISLSVPALIEVGSVVRQRRVGPSGQSGPAISVPVLWDVSSLRSPQGVYRGLEYVVTSAVFAGSSQVLREAGADYPDWVRRRYLQTPSSLPERVRQLAVDLTRNEPTTYDKAAAIERYLRGFDYNEAISAPPPERDAVDYFLFDSRQGFCDYFATAMAVLLRSVGVPARVVAGFNNGGDYDPARHILLVREANSHSWPQVYFPGYGWIDFEPTPSQSRPSNLGDLEDEGGSGGLSAEEEEGFGDFSGGASGGGFPNLATFLAFWAAVFRQIVVFAIALTGTFLALISFIAFRWQRGLRGLSTAQAAYARLCRFAAWLGQPRQGWETPYEYAHRLGRIAPAAAASIRAITEAFIREEFGRARLGRAELVNVQHSWRLARGGLVRPLLGLHPSLRWLRLAQGSMLRQQ